METSAVRMFIGSSTESKHYAEALQELVRQDGKRIFGNGVLKVTGWWDEKCFRTGSTTVESLEEILRGHNAAVLLASPDDTAIVREIRKKEMRSNVLFEYGMFCGTYGRSRVALAVFEGLSKPSDLLGITDIRLWAPKDWKKRQDLTEFKRSNRTKIKSWLANLKMSITQKSTQPEDVLPRLNAAIISIIRNLKESKHKFGNNIDILGSEMVAAVANAFDEHNKGIDEHLVKQIEDIVPESKAIFAIDVLGPSGWVSPRTYRYLAPQIKAYISRNTAGEKWHLNVDTDLGKAIKRASKNARKLKLPDGTSLTESLISFDLKVGPPNLQFSRILLWTEEELRTPVAESVVAIHEAFNVPLFFIPTPIATTRRDVDYIFFTGDSALKGFYGRREEAYATRPIKRGTIPGIGNAEEDYRKLLRRPEILFAADAREAIRIGTS